MYLLDTNVIINFCNAKLPLNAKELLQTIQPKISVITSIELFSSPKITQPELLKLNQFISIATVYNSINQDIVSRTIYIRQQFKIKLPDALIAATALHYNLILITRNTADFINIETLQTLNPWTISQ